MSAPSDLDDPFARLGGDLPRRPPPPRTWRDRLDDIAAVGVSPARLAAGLAALVVAAVVAWRLLAPPAPPPEVAIPFTEPQATVAGATGRDATTGPTGASGVSGASGVPATGPTGASGGPGSGGAAAATEVVVHVVGAVAAPGVQRLPAGARVVDAVDAAGGAAADADLGRLNLAAVLADGQQVYVLRLGESPPAVGSAGAGPTGGDPGAGAGSGGGAGALVDINTATAAELEELPGVGPTTAEAIIAHRERNGPFVSVDDLLDVRGIGDAKLEQLRERATV